MIPRLADFLTDPRRPRPGILRLGAGAFFRAHLAVYTTGAFRVSGGAWGIEVAGLRDSVTARQFMAQNGCFTLLVGDGTDRRAQILGPLLRAVAAIPARMAAPEIRIVPLIVTEKRMGARIRVWPGLVWLRDTISPAMPLPIRISPARSDSDRSPRISQW